MFYRGTLTEFNTWETNCRIAEGIPIDDSGKVNFVNGVAVPNNQKTIKYANCIPHPNDADDVIWQKRDYPIAEKEEITREDAISLGFISDAI